MYSIRPLALNDLKAAACLEAVCFPSFWTVEQFAASFKQSWFAGYGLFKEAELLAYITLSILEKELEVLNIAVHPSHRGKKLSRPLMTFALQDTLAGRHRIRKGMKKEGWEQGVLEVRAGNIPARALYKSLGFTEAGMRRHYYSDGEDAVVLLVTAETFMNTAYGSKEKT